MQALNQQDRLGSLTVEDLMTNQNISLTDFDPKNNLKLFCYDSCTNNSSQFVKNARGVVFQGDNLLLKGLPYTDVYSQLDSCLSDHLPIDVFSNTVFFDSYEGFLIRMFFVNDRWYTSTHRKLDAHQSKWGSNKSFGQIFEEYLGKQLEGKDFTVDNFSEKTLNKNRQYFFLVRNTKENRIVSDPPNKDFVYHVGTSENGVYDFFDDIGLPKPANLKFSDLKDCLDYVSKVDYHQKQGVIAFKPDGSQMKILNEDYNFFFKLRGNQPSIKFRYLELRNSHSDVEGLKYIYPEMISEFNKYEEILDKIADQLLDVYIKRYQNSKEYVQVNHDLHNILKFCVSLCEKKRQNINLEIVKEAIRSRTPIILNRLIKEYIQPNTKKNTYSLRDFLNKKSIKN